MEHSSKPTKVNIRVPLQLIRAGVELQGLLPAEARAQVNTALSEKNVGLDLNQLTVENIDALSDISIDIDAEGGESKVKVFASESPPALRTMMASRQRLDSRSFARRVFGPRQSTADKGGPGITSHGADLSATGGGAF